MSPASLSIRRPKSTRCLLSRPLWEKTIKRGWLELDLSAKRPKVKAELSSDKLDLRPLLAEKKKNSQKTKATKDCPPEEKEPKAKTPSKSGVQHARVFSAAPLPLAELQAIDVDLKFRDKQVLLPSGAR